MDIRPALYFKTPDHKSMLEGPIINMPKVNEKEYKGKNRLKIRNKVYNKKLKISLFEAHGYNG